MHANLTIEVVGKMILYVHVSFLEVTQGLVAIRPF